MAVEKLLLTIACCWALPLIGGSSSSSSQLLDMDNSGRIVGGEVISAYYLPYQVSVRRRSSNSSAYAHSCGGSLLDERTVITAAHCVYKREAENFLVVAGTEQRSGMDGGVVSRVAKIVMHEDYNATITDNDVALMFMAQPFPVGKHRKIDVIALAQAEPKPGTLATVSGWGHTTEGGVGSQQLQQVQVPLVAASECELAYDWRPITAGMLCAGLPEGGKDACQGDSGGPLAVDKQLLGIVSWGEGCARENYPGVYALVPHFLDWIAAQRAAHA